MPVSKSHTAFVYDDVEHQWSRDGQKVHEVPGFRVIIRHNISGLPSAKEFRSEDGVFIENELRLSLYIQRMALEHAPKVRVVRQESDED